MKIKLNTPEFTGEKETNSENIEKLLEELDIGHVNAVVTVNGEISLKDEGIEEGDEVKVRDVDSNG